MKRILAIIICGVVIFGCAAPAFADNAPAEQTEDVSLENIVQEIEESATTARRNFFLNGLLIVVFGLGVIYVLPNLSRNKRRRK